MTTTERRRAIPAHVALVCLSLHGGGAERVMVALANAFAAEGHTVDLVLLCGKGPRLREVATAVRVIDLAARHAALAAIPFYRYLRKERPQAVLSTLVGPNAIAVCASRMLPSESRARVVVREANTLSVALRYRSLAERVVAGAVARLFYPLADGIVAVSDDARNDLASFLSVAPERVVAIPNPSLRAEVRARAQEIVTHPWFREDREHPVLVAAGRLVPKKGFDVLIDAVALVRREREVHLQIMGDGPERSALVAQIARRGLGGVVELAGFVDNPFARFARADLFVLSSLAEGMPNALLEAMTCGCPVVATDCPSGPRELLRDGKDGRLVPPGDAAALAEAILGTLAHPPEREAMRERSAHFDVTAIAREYALALRIG